MTSTEAAFLPGSPGGLAVAAGEPPRLVAQERAATLTAIGVQRRAQEAAAARELVQVARWADLHRVDLPAGVAEEAREAQEPVQVPAAVTCPGVVSVLGGPLLGTEGVLQLAGEGTFAVTEFAV